MVLTVPVPVATIAELFTAANNGVKVCLVLEILRSMPATTLSMDMNTDSDDEDKAADADAAAAAALVAAELADVGNGADCRL